MSPEHPILVDKFLEDALEIDVDAIADGERVVVGGVMEHVEKAGIHSGDSACALPPYSLGDDQIERIKAQTRALARELGVIGLLNIQFAIKNEQVFVLEVNPRASRTVPFVSKAIGVPLAKLATKVMLGQTLARPRLRRRSARSGTSRSRRRCSPSSSSPAWTPILGPEMKSTGEVMGIDRDFRKAYVKSQLAAGSPLPTSGKVFLSVKNRDKRARAPDRQAARRDGLQPRGHGGHRQAPRAPGHDGGDGPQGRRGLPAEHRRPHEARGDRPRLQHARRTAARGRIPTLIRRTAVTQNIPYYTTVDGAQAAIGGIEALLKGEIAVQSLQEYHAHLIPRTASSSRSTWTPLDAERLARGRASTARSRRFKIGSQLFTAARPGRGGGRPQARRRGLPRPQVPRHPEHGGGRGARGGAARRVHVQCPRLRRPRHDARGGRGRGGRGQDSSACRRPLVLAVTVLTSLDRAALSRELGVASSVEGHVLHLCRARPRARDSTAAWPRPTRSAPSANASAPRWVIVTPGRAPGRRARPTTSRASRRRRRPPRAGRPLPRGRTPHHRRRRSGAAAAGRPRGDARMTRRTPRSIRRLFEIGAIRFGEFTLKSGIGPRSTSTCAWSSPSPTCSSGSARSWRPRSRRCGARPHRRHPLRGPAARGRRRAWPGACRSIYPRREEKGYGTKRRIEGQFKAGERVVADRRHHHGRREQVRGDRAARGGRASSSRTSSS